MCPICRKSPCDSRCPNAEPPEPLYECALCDDGIYHGESFAKGDGKYYHIECLKELSIRELLSLFDVNTGEAGE